MTALRSMSDWLSTAGVGELIWAMTTCRPDLAFASVKLSQSNSCPHKMHYHGLKQALKYLFTSKDDGIYFWRTSPCMDLPEGPLPPVHSNKQDLLLDNRPEHEASVLLAYADSDWATCVKTCRSFGGSCLPIAGGTVAYNTQFQPTIAGSSTEVEFMSAYFTGKMILFVRSVLWDLTIPGFKFLGMGSTIHMFLCQYTVNCGGVLPLFC